MENATRTSPNGIARQRFFPACFNDIPVVDLLHTARSHSARDVLSRLARVARTTCETRRARDSGVGPAPRSGPKRENQALRNLDRLPIAGEGLRAEGEEAFVAVAIDVDQSVRAQRRRFVLQGRDAVLR